MEASTGRRIDATGLRSLVGESPLIAPASRAVTYIALPVDPTNEISPKRNIAAAALAARSSNSAGRAWNHLPALRGHRASLNSNAPSCDALLGRRFGLCDFREKSWSEAHGESSADCSTRALKGPPRFHPRASLCIFRLARPCYSRPRRGRTADARQHRPCSRRKACAESRGLQRSARQQSGREAPPHRFEAAGSRGDLVTG